MARQQLRRFGMHARCSQVANELVAEGVEVENAAPGVPVREDSRLLAPPAFIFIAAGLGDPRRSGTPEVGMDHSSRVVPPVPRPQPFSRRFVLQPFADQHCKIMA
jgi:hypothetical protein